MLTLGLAGAAGATPSVQSIMQAELLEQDSVGFSAAPPMVASRELPGTWRAIALPYHPSAFLLDQAAQATKSSVSAPDATRITWVRLRLPKQPTTLSTARVDDTLALYSPRLRADGPIAIYADGQLLRVVQSGGPLWNGARIAHLLPLTSAGGKAPTEVLLRLQHFSKSQVVVSTWNLGSLSTLRPGYELRQWLQTGFPAYCSATFLVVAIFALFVWLRRRESAYLLFFLLGVTSFVRSLHFFIADVPILEDGFSWLTLNGLFWLITVTHFAIAHLHGQPQRALGVALALATALTGLVTWPGLGWFANTDLLSPLIYVLGMCMSVAVVVAGWLGSRKRSREGLWVTVCMAICTGFGVVDWLLQVNLLGPPLYYPGAYINAMTFVVFGTLIYHRYAGAIDQVEAANAVLAQRLAEREAELDLSWKRLLEIEQRQTVANERQRLMQDMHDGLGHTLHSALRAVECGQLNESTVTEMLRDCIDDLRLTIDSMEPTQTDLPLLLATLRHRLGPRLSAAGVHFKWEVQDLPPLAWLDPSSALHILRILQEAFTNIIKHAKADEICVSTAVLKDRVTVSIADNGFGFDVEQALQRGQGRGRGLQSQLSRAALLGAKLSWLRERQGMVMCLDLPIERTKPMARAAATRAPALQG